MFSWSAVWRDATRVIPPAIRNRYLRHLGRTMFRANYGPLREPYWSRRHADPGSTRPVS